MGNEMTTTKVETAVANWDDELARQAKEAMGQEASTGGGNFFSLRGGQLKLNGAQLPDNQMVAVVLDSLLVNAYYPEAFDPDSPQVPTCYAIGRDEQAMSPHELAAGKQAPNCVGCEHNQFGSKGRGKACRNMRRLALIPGGSFSGNRAVTYETAEEIGTALLAYLMVPPTSVMNFGSFVKQLGGAMGLPPRAVFTKVRLVPDPKCQFKLEFSAIAPIPRELLGAVMARAQEVAAVIDFPFPSAGGGAGGTPTTQKSSGAKKSKKF